MNVYGYDPTAGLKHACVVNAAVAYIVHDTGQVVILSINQVIKIKGLNHNLFHLMQSCMNGVLIDEVPKFLAPILHETTDATQIENPFDATHIIIIPLKLNRVTTYFKVRKPTWEEYEDQNIPKIELMVEAPPWDPSNPDYSQQEQSMFDYRGWFVSPNTPARGQLYINSVTAYAYDAANVMDDDNYATVLDSSLQSKCNYQ